MNGAESLLRTLVGAQVRVCFANPGTSEMHFVAALDKVEGMRPVLGLFEGAVTGMADGYGRMAEHPAVTLLHLGGGLGNGLANLHNARRAATPIVNIVGDHASFHAQYDTPLASDIKGIARAVSGWVHTASSALTVAADAAKAVAASLEPPGQIATLILPADAAWNEAEGPAAALPRPVPTLVTDAQIDRVSAALLSGKRTVILVRGAALKERGLLAAGRIAAKTGVRLMCDTLTPRVQRGAGRVSFERVPYRGEHIVEAFKNVEQLILVGTHPPVATFAYPDKPSWCLPAGLPVLYLAHPHEDGVQALEAVAEAIKAPVAPAFLAELHRPEPARGALDANMIGRVIARHLPEGAVISDEGASSSMGTELATVTAAPHDYLSNTGGAIGQGMPVGVGAAVAAPDRKIVCLQADGSAMYTLQALWTQAREKLDITTVLLSNHSYAVLMTELARVGAGSPGPRALSMLDLGNPELSWIEIAKGMGVEATRAATSEQFEQQFLSAMMGRGPRLIEAII